MDFSCRLLRLTIVVLSSLFSVFAEGIEERAFVTIIPSHNNLKWFKKNLRSILNQDYKNHRLIYIDDCSTDFTSLRLKSYLKKLKVDYREVIFDDKNMFDIQGNTELFCKEINIEKNFFILVKNLRKCGAMANYYRAVHSCNDDEIIINLDGDDWLYDDEVLKRVNEVYDSGEVWFTHGTLIEFPSQIVAWSEAVPPSIIEKNAFRQSKCPSHLRTYYAWLFKKIKLVDFLYEGEFLKMTCDMAIMFPIAEMAGDRHAFIPQVNYVYNMTNPINDSKVDAQLQNDLDKFIRQKKVYDRLKNDEIPKFMQNDESKGDS